MEDGGQGDDDQDKMCVCVGGSLARVCACISVCLSDCLSVFKADESEEM